MLVIPVLFVMKYLFSYDVKAVVRRANRKARQAEKRAARAKKSKEKAKESQINVALKYAVLAKDQKVEEADESDSSTDSETSDEEIDDHQAKSMQSCAGRLGWLLAFCWSVAAVLCILGVVQSFTVRQAWIWLGVQGMTHSFKFFLDEPLKISLIYFLGPKINKWISRWNKATGG